MSTEVADLRKEIADLEVEVDRLQCEVDDAERAANDEAAEIIEAALVKQDAFLDDIGRECHDEYQHEDAFPFCRATPCASIRNEIESRDRKFKR